MDSVQKEETHRFTCPYEDCSARFSKNSKLVYHVRRHTGERPFVCEEENCNKSYTSPAHLVRHRKIVHYNCKSAKIPCPFEGCSITLADKFTLEKHCKRKHNPNREYPFPCKECGRGFFIKRDLLQHSYEHTGVPPFQCDQCNMRFLTLRHCNRHKRTHTIYSCICSESFERWRTLCAHKKICETVRTMEILAEKPNF